MFESLGIIVFICWLLGLFDEPICEPCENCGGNRERETEEITDTFEFYKSGDKVRILTRCKVCPDCGKVKRALEKRRVL